MDEYQCISKKQYCILLAFSLELIFTTSSVPAFCSAVIQIILFTLVNLLVFSKISNKRVCWGIFLSLAALMGEGMLFLSDYLPDSFSSGGFFLLPASTFLFLTAPIFSYISEEKKISAEDLFRGSIFFVPAGILIATVRELFGLASFLGIEVPGFSRWKIRFFGHTAGAAILVLGLLVAVSWWKSLGEEKKWLLETSEKRSRIYHPISAKTERKFIVLTFCMLIYYLIFGAIGAVTIYSAPLSLIKPAHIVLMSAVTSILILTLLVKIFRISETMDDYFYLPLLSVITTSTPLIVYTGYLDLPSQSVSAERIVWWVALMVGVWLFTGIVLAYARSINERFLFSKQPRCLEGIPFILLHVLLAMIVFTPWTQVLTRL